MVSQAVFERVAHHVIAPLSEIYGEMPEAQAKYLPADLERYSAKVLDMAMTELRQTRRSLPSTAQIIEVCDKHAPAKPTPEPESYEWAQKRQRARKAQQEYMAQQRWPEGLRPYVAAVAWVQAQMIERCGAIGWDGATVFLHRQGRITDDEKTQFLREQREQAERGQIDVTVSPPVSECWLRQRGGQAQAMERHNVAEVIRHARPRADKRWFTADAATQRRMIEETQAQQMIAKGYVAAGAGI